VTDYRVTFPALGTTAAVVACDPGDLIVARRVLWDELARIDLACSRFRPDSAVAELWRAGGRPVVVGEALLEAIQVALRAAELTDGLVDPTVGASVVALGYDRDFAEVARHAVPAVPVPQPAPGWRAVRVDCEAGTVQVPPGTLLDLGATAKALAVDRAAATCAAACRRGVLVSVGGDLALAGPAPHGGWPVLVTDDSGSATDGPGQRVALRDGALATSSTAARQWRAGGRLRHHLVLPATGDNPPDVWRTASVAAATCVDANIASTAAMLMGEKALAWLAARQLPARLVRVDGTVVAVGGWPATDTAPAPDDAPAADDPGTVR